MNFWPGHGLFLPAKTKLAGVVVEIYSKPDCHLCDEAKVALVKMQRHYGFQLREVNIAGDPALLAEYGTRIPLIWVDGHLVCKYFVDEAAMVKRLKLSAAEKQI
ncbi:glutaredoxin family protein [candidate division KSB1 bacterium]|nr:glutaredoxin family protein [candidate division KSB1 bacterium]